MKTLGKFVGVQMRHTTQNTTLKKMIKDVITFHGFGISTGYLGSSIEGLVDACLDAMEKCRLHVCAKNNQKHYLWEAFLMQPLQWKRVCDILHRQGLGTSVLWSTSSSAYHTLLVADVDCMWENLDVIKHGKLTWVYREVERRQWRNGLRRAWLAVTAV